MADSNLSPEAQAQLAKLAIDLANDPKIGKSVKKRISEIDPTKRFLDVEVDEIRDTIKTEFETRDLETKKEKALAEQRAQKMELLNSGRFKPEDIEKMEKEVMEKHGISDYNIAAKIYSADIKPATPTHEIKGRTWEMPKLSKEDLNNLPKYSLNEAYRTVDELRKRA